MANHKIERFDRTNHQRDGFCCGKPALDDFLRSLVSQYEKRMLGTTYVAVNSPDDRVLGYYTISSSSVPFDHLPSKLTKKLPKHPIPVVLLGRLAVDHAAQGKGMGADLLLDALHRIEGLSKNLGIFAVEVDAIDADAQSFYAKFGFESFLDNERHLFLPVATIEKLVRGRP